MAKYASEWGYDGLEIACSGEHLDVWRAAEDDAYLQGRLDILDKYGLKVWAISNHLKGQAVCDDPIDFRHQAIVGSKVWGDGDPEGVRQRAAEELKLTAKVARKLGVDTVVGFTGSEHLAVRRAVPAGTGRGLRRAATRTSPTAGTPSSTCSTVKGVRFAHEVHPSEIAYDYWTSVRTLEAIDHREAFGFNWDPSHMMWQDIDPVGFIVDFQDRIYHVDCKDTRLRPKNGRAGVLGSHLPWGDPRRGWDFVSTGHGDVPWEDSFRALESIGYTGPISIEWEDAGMDRLHGAKEAVGYIRSLLWKQPTASFDAAFSNQD